MADSFHVLITQVRDGYIKSLTESVNTLFANLESKIRDTQAQTNSSDFVSKKEFNDLKDTVENKILPALNQLIPSVNAITPMLIDWKSDIDELKHKIENNTSSKDVIINKPQPSKMSINEKVETTVPINNDVESISSPVDCEGNTKFTALEVDGENYWLDDDHIVYKETDEGYEEIGSYDPETGELHIEDDEDCEGGDSSSVSIQEEENVDDEEMMEEEEEEEELEMFEYKGETYYRDSDNLVYNESVEVIGTWNGKKIVFQKSS